MTPADLSPGAEQARRWVQEELSRDEYHQGGSLLERVMRWIGELFQRAGDARGTGFSIAAHPLVAASVAALLLGLVVLLLTRVRTRRVAPAAPPDPLGELALTPEQFRDRAAEAMRAQRWGDAVVQYTRALARDAADRTLLHDAPSLTAHEVGDRLRAVFPDHAEGIVRTMDLFDAVRYGRFPATQADAQHTRATCETLRQARPRLLDAVAAPAWSAPGGAAPAPLTPPPPPDDPARGRR